VTGFQASNATIDLSVPTQPGTISVQSIFCWIIVQENNGDDSFDWMLPWADYKAGFGSLGSNYWLGLERLHLLTSVQPYRLRVEVKQLSDGRWFSAEYWSFQIGDETTDQYRLDISGYTENAGNSLLYNASLR